MIQHYVHKIYNSNIQREKQAQCQTVFVGLGSDALTTVSLPFVRPHLAARNDMSGQTAAEYNCMEGSRPHPIAYSVLD